MAEWPFIRFADNKTIQFIFVSSNKNNKYETVKCLGQFGHQMFSENVIFKERNEIIIQYDVNAIPVRW